MKRIFIFLLVGSIIAVANAQMPKHVAHLCCKTEKIISYNISEIYQNTSGQNHFLQNHKITSTNKTANIITDIPIGTSANAFGFFGNGRTYLWADDNINTVIFTHRAAATPGSGYLQYDISKNGGTTWAINAGPLYSPDGGTYDNARYPMGLIYNPEGNLNPDSSFVTYLAPTLDASNGSWGGTCYGVHQISNLLSSTQHVFTSGSSYRAVIPNAFHITQSGVAWGINWSDSLNANGYAYSLNDDLIIYKGVWNQGTHDMDYTRSLYNIPMTANPASPLQKHRADEKIAFAPDGQTGYIAIIGHNDWSFMPDSVYYPILYKTVDSGSTWTGPINVDISSIPDIQAIYGDSILYTTGFELDLAVDGNGNPYLVTEVSPAPGQWSISIAPGYLTLATIYSTDGGITWDGRVLEYLQTFRGTFTDGTNTITCDNRPQVATNLAGTIMTFTWVDTDTMTFGSADGNYYPDLHLRGFNVSDHIVTPALTSSSNVTTGSSADGAAYLGSSSYYVFDLGSNQYEVPMVYQQMDCYAPLNPVTYHYIKGAVLNLTVVSTEDYYEIPFTVNQNYPNPFDLTSEITIELHKTADLSMSISNLLGQKVYETSKGSVNAGTYYFSIDGSKLTAGVYAYTVKAGDYSVTHKMVVE